jgi:DNA-binding NtrC family response regulator
MTASARPLRDSRSAASVKAAIIGRHPSMIRLVQLTERAAPLNAPVLIQGPTGSGKELVANLLHEASGRAGAIVAVNVAELAEQLVESELFGSVRGAFTGSIADRRGLIDEAGGGTLYLDEASELTPGIQIKLLRVLESGVIRPVGGSKGRRVDFRLVVSTQQPAAQLAASGRWRSDFYFRVAGLVLEVPPLRQRASDIPLLVDHFLDGLGCAPIAPELAQELRQHSWPGNVRELKRTVEQAAFVAEGGPISRAGLRQSISALPRTSSLLSTASGRSLKEVERSHIEAVLTEEGFNTERAAAVLEISVHQLYRRFLRLGIVPPRQRSLGKAESANSQNGDYGSAKSAAHWLVRAAASI